MAETTKTSAPRRASRPAAARTGNAKRPAATVKKAQTATAPDEAATETPLEKGTAVEYTHTGDSANYSKWVAPDGSGFTGTVYAPLGTKTLVIYAQ